MILQYLHTHFETRKVKKSRKRKDEDCVYHRRFVKTQHMNVQENWKRKSGQNYRKRAWPENFPYDLGV